MEDFLTWRGPRRSHMSPLVQWDGGRNIPLLLPTRRHVPPLPRSASWSSGLVIGAVVGAPQVEALRLPPWLIGLLVGVLLSAADAVITKAYAPIMILGAVGGAAIGWLVGRFGR